MRSEYRIVEYQPKYRSDVLGLAQHIWGPEPSRNSAYLDWKYARTPNFQRKSPLIFLALHRNRVVGMRGVHAMKLEVDGIKGFVLPCFGDTVIDPEHRGKGLLTSLTEPAIKTLTNLGYSYILGVSNAPATYFHLLKHGWKQAFGYERLYAETQDYQLLHRSYQLARRLPIIYSLVKALRRPARRAQNFTFAKQHNLFANLDVSSAGESAHIVVDLDPRPIEMADLISRLSYDGRIRQIKDVAYLDWRYKNPKSIYRFIFYYRLNKLMGYLTLQTSEKSSVVNLVDWEASDVRVLKDLIQAVMRWGAFNSVTTWSATLSNETVGLLQEAGFTLKIPNESNTSYRPGLLVRSLEEGKVERGWSVGARSILDINNWNLRMIQSDDF